MIASPSCIACPSAFPRCRIECQEEETAERTRRVRVAQAEARARSRQRQEGSGIGEKDGKAGKSGGGRHSGRKPSHSDVNEDKAVEGGGSEGSVAPQEGSGAGPDQREGKKSSKGGKGGQGGTQDPGGGRGGTDGKGRDETSGENKPQPAGAAKDGLSAGAPAGNSEEAKEEHARLLQRKAHGFQRLARSREAQVSGASSQEKPPRVS